jgi:DNA primase large subunit
MVSKDLIYLRCMPFLSNADDLITELNITIEKIEDTNVYDNILVEINDELILLLTSEPPNYPIADYHYEVIKFYFTILILKALDNIALTRIWVRHFLYRIRTCIATYVNNNELEDNIKFFLDVFRLLDKDQKFQLRKITLESKDQTFGIHMMDYLDIVNEISNSEPERYQQLKLVNMTLHKGYVVIGFHETEILSAFIEYYARIKFFQYYNFYGEDENIQIVNSLMQLSKKISLIVNKLKRLIVQSEYVSLNVKKHYVPKEILYEQEKIKDVEKSNVIIKDIMETGLVSIEHFPPCINVLLEKIVIKKIPLTHNENILLCTYLAKKHFIKDHIIKIFSKAVNYNKKTTDYQVRSLVDKNLMCMNCVNLQTEGICHKELDKTKQCERIKNPLSFR